MARKYDMAVMIGRFQPFHVGHLSVIDHGLEVADNVLILVGSADGPRCYRNPFTYDERVGFIKQSIPADLRKRVRILPLADVAYNDSQWINRVQQAVDRTAWLIGYTSAPKVALIGHSKDNSSYYLKMFPQWDSVEAHNFKGINSTQIRNVFFSNIGHMWLSDCDGHKDGDLPQDKLVTPAVRMFLAKFIESDEYKQIKDEYEFIEKYKLSWAAAPYAPVFVTVDAVVVQGGHVLLVKRAANPGKGLWAMPGGFINQDEKILDAVIRELKEETGIKVPEAVLKGSIVERDVFDDPNRSARGRTITHAFLIKLKDERTLPKVKGADDAEKAKWVPISKLKPQDFFEDHLHIIQNLLARI